MDSHFPTKISSPSIKVEVKKMNEIVLYDNYAEVILCDKHRSECGRAKISLDMVEECSKYRWWLHRDGYAYCKVKVGVKPNGNGIWKNIQMSRFIANTPDGLIADHINHDTLDNRNENLRNCTNQQNMFNMRQMNGKPIKGVRKVCNKWYARLKVDGVEHSKGGFETEEEAISARKEMEEIYYGKFRYGDSR